MNQDEPVTDAGRRFGQAVRAARARTGISQRRLSELIMAESDAKLYPSSVTRIETGQREPRLSEAIAIAQALGMSLSELVDNPVDDNTRFDQLIDRIPVTVHHASESLKHAASEFQSLAELLRKNPELLGKMKFADGQQPQDVGDYLRQVASGFPDRRPARSRSKGARDADELRDGVVEILVALARSIVPDGAET